MRGAEKAVEEKLGYSIQLTEKEFYRKSMQERTEEMDEVEMEVREEEDEMDDV